MVTSMKTSLTLFATVALLALAANPALAGNDRHKNEARWDRDQTHYRGGDHRAHSYRGHSVRYHRGYRPKVDRHYYHRHHDVRHVRYYHRPSHRYYDRSHHHGHHDLIAIIGGAILVNEILDH
jgi:Ni/Co efflux regulator RcnB